MSITEKIASNNCFKSNIANKILNVDSLKETDHDLSKMR